MGTASDRNAPYAWATCVTMVGQRAANPENEKSQETWPPVRIALCNSVHEVGIASGAQGQHAALNTFTGLIHTAKHTMEVDFARST